MPATKITGFLGTAPKFAPELLAASAAQVANNCKLYSGDLIPYPTPYVTGATGRSGIVETIYALRNPTTNDLVWLSWTSHVSVVTLPFEDLEEKRFYYTGDGNAKVSTYALATSGTAPYPSTNGYYDLGLPLPTTVLTTTATAFTTITSATISRDTANNVTVVTPSAHNLKTGAVVSITGLSPTTFNTITSVTVESSTKFTYYAVGPSGSATGTPSITLGGAIQGRTYLYTWYTPWDEESIGSEPSEALFIKEGQIVTVSNLPTQAPTGRNFVRGVRLYRTLSGTTTAAYFLLKTLWFPNSLSKVKCESGVATVTLAHPHNFIENDRFRIAGCSDSTFNGTGAVSSIVDSYTFSYSKVSADIAEKTVTGTLYYDVAESLDDTARYWGYLGDYSFTDDFNYISLSQSLNSTEYAPPPDGIKGLVVVQSTFLAGFVGNTLYFSEPNQFHAWPDQYKITFESNIVGLSVIGQDILVLTDEYPYVVSGSDPAVTSQYKLPSRYPCVSATSISETSNGIIWATHDGLAIWSPSSGVQLITRGVHSSDTWNAALDPSTLVGVAYKDTYIASHSNGTIVLDAGNKADSASFVNSDFKFTATWYDFDTNALYVASGIGGSVYRWDDVSQPPLKITWKSRVIKTDGYVNLGAARIIADYSNTGVAYTWDNANINWESANQLWDTTDPIIFRLYVNKVLKTEITISSDGIFRLPNGYKSDTFEIEIDSYVRVRAIQFGDTPISLREV
jgi:hypothetical protein